MECRVCLLFFSTGDEQTPVGVPCQPCLGLMMGVWMSLAIGQRDRSRMSSFLADTHIPWSSCTPCFGSPPARGAALTWPLGLRWCPQQWSFQSWCAAGVQVLQLYDSSIFHNAHLVNQDAILTQTSIKCLHLARVLILTTAGPQIITKSTVVSSKCWSDCSPNWYWRQPWWRWYNIWNYRVQHTNK